jgi:hypothetical protein
MGPAMTGNGLTTCSMVRVRLYTLMVQNTLENGKKISNMASARQSTQMDQNIKEIGLKTKNMDEEKPLLLVVRNTSETISTEIDMAKEL